MPSSSPEKGTGQQSFLRTASGAALHARIPQETQAEATPAEGDRPVFPAPAPPEQIAARMGDWPCFVALAIRFDLPPAEENNTVTGILSGCLEAMIKQSSGVWFAWKHGLYGAALPEIDMHAAAASARRLQMDLAASCTETISVGISRFPQLDFSCQDVLQNACKALDHAAFFGPGSIVEFDAVSLNISGDYRYQDGDLAKAIAEYRTALRLAPNNVNVHNSLGICLAQSGDRDGARAAFESAQRLDPREAMAAYNLGVLWLLEKQPAAALKQFRQAYALEAQTFEIPFQIGKLLSEQKAYAEAIPYLEKAIEIRNTSAPAHTLLGRCRASLGQTHPAIAAYQRAVKINPYDAAALSALGSLYDVKGENPEICVTFCRQSVTLAPENGLFRLRLARLYHKHNQLDRALAEYESATALGCDASHQIADIQEQLAAGDKGKQCCA
ncbi:MAG: tetratricopeptide repeat protein [Desulfobacterales bacterium]|nr:tetratricopeptide repeat protein [Desulfobacterales bacterium]